MNYCYVADDYATLFVGNDDFDSDLITGSMDNTSPWSASAPTNHTFQGVPRISSPTTVTTHTNLWTVVTSRINDLGTIYDIVGFTLYSGSVTSNVYTDGSFSLCDINDEYQRSPAVSYCNDSVRGPVVGWTSTFSGDSHFENMGILALRCNLQGQYSSLGGAARYWVVFEGNVNAGATDHYLSLTGRDYQDELLYYTFWD